MVTGVNIPNFWRQILAQYGEDQQIFSYGLGQLRDSLSEFLGFVRDSSAHLQRAAPE